MQAAFHHIQIAHQRVGDAVVLNAVATAKRGGVSKGWVFFAAGRDEQAPEPAGDTKFTQRRTLGATLAVQTASPEPPEVVCGDHSGTIHLSAAQHRLLKGQNTALAFRNGQTAEITLDWLKWHVTHHGMTAALIVDRAKPGENDAYLAQLRDGLSAITGLKTVVVVQFDHPLGRHDLPSEMHPFCAPDAPGKDRMEIPEADPWTAPLGELGIFELLRHRFLAKARAVAQIDLTDLLLIKDDAQDETVFDRAQQSGVVPLVGQHVYPWRVRSGQTAHFADHACRQFDKDTTRDRWCVAPEKVSKNTVWRFVRIVGAVTDRAAAQPFARFMGLRHPGHSVSQIVPKSSLIEDMRLLSIAQDHFAHDPVRMPTLAAPVVDTTKNAVTIITTMKNEGPFILEWIAYHRAIGVENFLVYTNDCTDGTDDFHDLLQAKGIVQHRQNPYRDSGMKPQHAALQAGEQEDVIKNAGWVICMDVDEFINVKTGDGTLAALFDATGDANMISLTWRLFGNSDVHAFEDRPILETFTKCAPEMARKPHQAWGFKTLFRNIGLYKKLGVHRPKGLNPQLWQDIKWVNGSGHPMPKDTYRNAWRSTQSTVGYDLVSLNHYAVRSAESFLVKRDRGRVNHVDRDQGLNYWFRMNHNVTQDTSIQRILPALRAEMDRLLQDPEIAAMHRRCVTAHREKINALKATPSYADFYETLTSDRMQRLSKLLPNFGANVFLAGPDVVPDHMIFEDQPGDFFFTVGLENEAAE
ncbi:glycosyltransferase family 2 protein [Cognatishimia maritima]|uniref:Glycosyl transferase family 2 n=1 Tax=Cognatishimia maritima TaxID=870908 RepID=A0A1M5T6P7_9RHOB|nr:glycosyltransferase family 2 protein [Cognatishimia maritima]SHH46280.1 Glycosyl transferase family 2 [Cognatishimia maritima]